MCEHHTEHTADCGYTEAQEGAECTHEHTDECYSEVTNCVHSHDEVCGYTEGTEGTPCNHVHDEECGESAGTCWHAEHNEDCGYAEAQEGNPCTHECSVDTGCVTKELNCQHTHDENCGYKEAVEGTPCNYTCTECTQTEDKQNNDQPEEEPAECTCETDDESIHATNCPLYVAPENSVCTCAEKCSEDNVNVWCDVCGVEGIEGCTGNGEAAAFADTIISQGICGNNEETGNDADNATYVIYDTDGDNAGDKMVISGTGATASYGWDSSLLIKDSNAGTVTTVVIEEGITTIGGRLLYGMTNLTTLYLPNSLKTINSNGVAGCTSLTDIKFSDNPSLETLGNAAFCSCTSLCDEELLQLSSLKTLESSSLGNTAYNPVILPPSVTSVNAYAIGDANKILYVPQSAIENVDVSDWYCGIVMGYELDTTKNEAAITSMYSDYWSGFSDGITLPTLFGCTVTSVEQRHAEIPILCTSHIIENRTCKICGYTTMCGDNCWWEYADGVLYIKGSGDMYDFHFNSDADNYPEWMKLYKDEIREVRFAEDITRIGNNVCYEATNLENIVFEGDQIKEIGQMVFAGCTKLTDVPLEKLTSLEGIRASAFSNCISLENITLSARSLLGEPFYLCTDTTRFAFNEDLKFAYEFGLPMLFYKTVNGKKVVTVPFADMLEIPDIEYFEGEGVLQQPQDVIKIKEEYAKSYTFDGYTYGIDVDFTDFTYSIEQGTISGVGDYVLKLSYPYTSNRLNEEGELIIFTNTLQIPFKVVDHVHSTGQPGDKEATCQEQAYCSVCQSYYGEKDATNHEEFTYADNENGTHKKTCTKCGDEEEENHSLDYSVRDNTITVSCSNECGYQGTATLTVADKTYDGEVVTAVVEKTGSLSGKTITVTYVDSEGNEFDSAPVNAGTYTASITLGEGDNAVMVSGEFTIKKVTPKVIDVPTVADRVYHPTETLADSDLTNGTVKGVDGNNLAGTWNWQSANIVPVVDNNGYIAVFTPQDSTNYETVTRTITVTVTKATPHIVSAEGAAITYGDTLSASAINGTAQYSNSDPEMVAGNFAWAEASTKPAAADSNTTAYAVIFTPSDTVNYNTVETDITLTVKKAENAPNMPGTTMNVSNKYTKLGDVPLPEGWQWQEPDKETALEVDTPITATAVYMGTDKGNYEKETVSISVTRNACDHVAGDILYTGEGEKAPTCTESGLGHKECKECGTVMESGIVVNALGHTGGTATCKDKAVCTRCKQPYGSTDGSKHGDTEVRGYRAATCTSGGYTGDTYCKDCGTKLSSGTSTGVKGHNYVGTVTTEPTTDKEGVMTYTCLDCGHTYTKSIEKLADDSSDKEPDDNVTDDSDNNPDDNVTDDSNNKPDDNVTDDSDNNPDDGSDDSDVDTRKPFIKDDAGKEGWDVIRDEIEDATDGDTITVDMNGSTVVSGNVFADIKDKDIMVVFDMGNGITWSVNGKDITSDSVGDIDFGVKIGAEANNTIPVQSINEVTGESYYMNISLSYDGEFGFKAVLSINLEEKNAGLYANLYYYNEQTGELEFVCADEIASDGTAELTFTHASEYTVVIDQESMEMADGTSVSANPLEFGSDDEGSAWWILILFAALVAVGVIIIILKKKNQDGNAQ